MGAHLGLVQVPDGEACMRQLILCQREQKVRLILAGVDAAQETVAPVILIKDHSRVVPGGHHRRIQAGRTFGQRGKLQVGIAVHTRNRCAAR